MTQVINHDFTANGQSPTEKWGGGKGYFNAFGSDFGGGTVSLQYSLDNSATWIAMGENTTITANGGGVFDQTACNIRVNLSGATSPVIKSIITKLRFE